MALLWVGIYCQRKKGAHASERSAVAGEHVLLERMLLEQMLHLKT